MGQNYPMTREELFADLALKAGFLSPKQLEDIRRLRARIPGSSLPLSLPDVVAKKEMLTHDQLRMLNVAILYEELRHDDEDLAEFIIQKGSLPAEKVRECLAEQEDLYREGHPFPRLEELLARKKYLSDSEVQAILQARALNSAVSAAATARPDLPPRPLPPALRAIQAGSMQETLKVGFRRARITGESYAAVLDLSGSLDGHTAPKFDEYLNAVNNGGFVRLVFVCEKLHYISSAGIGIFAAAIKRCRDGEGDLRLCSVDDKMRRIMRIIGLLSLARVYENEREAVDSFKS